MGFDFKLIRQTVSVEHVLVSYGVHLRRVDQVYLRGDCPLPTHTSKSRRTFVVNTHKNLWICHSRSCAAASGRKGGDVVDLACAMERCSPLCAAQKLTAWLADAKQCSQPAEPSSSQLTPERNEPLGFELTGVAYHPYLALRGITRQTAEFFGVGYFEGRGLMANRIVVPIHDENGELIAYAGRSLDGQEPKYRLPFGFHKRLVLYNRHRVSGGQVVLVEGFFGCVKVQQAGFPCVALMGRYLSPEQERLLDFDSNIAMLDDDEPGREATQRLLPRLCPKAWVRVVTPKGQPDEMTTDELQELLSPLF